jgi:hypothetical protein
MLAGRTCHSSILGPERPTDPRYSWRLWEPAACCTWRRAPARNFRRGWAPMCAASSIWGACGGGHV